MKGHQVTIATEEKYSTLIKEVGLEKSIELIPLLGGFDEIQRSSEWQEAHLRRNARRLMRLLQVQIGPLHQRLNEG
jgi:hypothetical protein